MTLGAVYYSEWMTDAQDIDAAATSTANDIIVVGDFGVGYKIIDRMGLRIEVMPHLVGSNQRPISSAVTSETRPVLSADRSCTASHSWTRENRIPPSGG